MNARAIQTVLAQYRLALSVLQAKQDAVNEIEYLNLVPDNQLLGVESALESAARLASLARVDIEAAISEARDERVSPLEAKAERVVELAQRIQLHGAEHLWYAFDQGEIVVAEFEPRNSFCLQAPGTPNDDDAWSEVAGSLEMWLYDMTIAAEDAEDEECRG